MKIGSALLMGALVIAFNLVDAGEMIAAPKTEADLWWFDPVDIDGTNDSEDEVPMGGDSWGGSGHHGWAGESE